MIEISQTRLAAAKEAQGNDRLAACVRNMTTLQLELMQYANELKTYKLPGKLAPFPGMISVILQNQRELYGEIGDNCKALIAMKPGTDVGSLAAEAPKLTAEANYNENTLVKIGPAVAMTLIDTDRKDAKGNFDHLIVPKNERAAFLKEIKGGMKGISEKEASGMAFSVFLVKMMLEKKDYKSADEP